MTDIKLNWIERNGPPRFIAKVKIGDRLRFWIVRKTIPGWFVAFGKYDESMVVGHGIATKEEAFAKAEATAALFGHKAEE